MKADVKALQTAFFETTETAGEEVQLLRSRKKKFIEYRSTYDSGPPSHASWQDRLSRLRAPQESAG